MKNLTLLFIFLILPFLSKAQERNYLKYNRYHFKHLKYGQKEYINSLYGVKKFLKDLEKDDPEIHQKLVLDYEKFNRRRNGSSILRLLSFFGGIALIRSGVRNHETADGSLHEYYDSPRVRVGALLFVGGLITGTVIKPNRRKFIYNFTEQFNEYSKEKKLEFSLRSEINKGNQPSTGLALIINF